MNGYYFMTINTICIQMKMTRHEQGEAIEENYFKG